MLKQKTINTLLKSDYPVLLFANGYGDHYINLPTIRALATLFNGRLVLVGIKGAINQIAGDLTLHKLVELPMRHNGTGRSFDVKNALSLISHCDLFISLNPWQSDDLSQLIDELKPQTSIGFFKDYDISITRDYNKHAIDLAFDVVHLFRPDWQPEQFSKAPRFELNDIEFANKIVNSLPTNQKLLCIHPDTLPEKMWSEQNWIQLIDTFLNKYPNYTVIIIGLSGIDSTQCQNQQSIIPAYRLPISVSALLLSKAALFIGVDSVFLHIADLYRIRTIALFGPTSIQEWGIRFSTGCHLGENSDMKNISVEQVFKSISQLLTDQTDNTRLADNDLIKPEIT